jgi:hypothetical protein
LGLEVAQQKAVVCVDYLDYELAIAAFGRSNHKSRMIMLRIAVPLTTCKRIQIALKRLKVVADTFLITNH